MRITQWKSDSWQVWMGSLVNALKSSPLLWGWLVVGLLITALQDGLPGFVLGMVNLALLGVYVLLIRWLTPDSHAALPVRRPRFELAAALGVFGLVFAVQLLDFGVLQAQPWLSWVRGFFSQVRAWVFAFGLPEWASRGVFSALSSTIKQLLPTLLLLWMLSIRRQAAGIARPHWRLTSVLVAITAAFGLLTGALRGTPIWQVLALYGLGIFINALPEELFFRGLLLPRLEVVFGNSMNALVVSALLFNLMHLPLAVSHGQPLTDAFLAVFRVDYPSGLLWGYLYLRTRSILPSLFWHAANGRLGFLFLDL